MIKKIVTSNLSDKIENNNLDLKTKKKKKKDNWNPTSKHTTKRNSVGLFYLLKIVVFFLFRIQIIKAKNYETTCIVAVDS
jgi:hypothetical protein